MRTRSAEPTRATRSRAGIWENFGVFYYLEAEFDRVAARQVIFDLAEGRLARDEIGDIVRDYSNSPTFCGRLYRDIIHCVELLEVL